MQPSVAIAVVITCAFHVQYIVGEDCSEIGVASCAEEFAKLGREYIPRNYSESCRIIQAAFACLKRKMDNCQSDMIATSYEKSKGKMESTCGPNSLMRKVYTNNRDCIQSMSNEYSQCEAKFQDILARLTSNQDNIAQMCCGLNQVTDCAVSLTTGTCGADAANYPKEAMRINIESSNMNCNEYTVEDMRCAPFIFERSETPVKPSKATTTRPGKHETRSSTAYTAYQGKSVMASIGLLVISIRLI